MLEDAGLENFPQLWAEAIVSGSLHLDSLYATKLSDSAVNINRSKAEGFRYSQVYKLVCALASSRPRCGAAPVHVFRHPCILPTRPHARAATAAALTALRPTLAPTALGRAQRSRQLFAHLLHGWDIKTDEASGDTYYYNEQTGESQWTKPKALGDDDLPPYGVDATKPSPRTQYILDAQKAAHVKKPPPQDMKEAALRIESMWRRRQARKLLHDMAAGCYDKLWEEHDPETY